MEKWMKLSLMICTFGCLKEIRPSEPFITEYLTGHWKNFTADTINREVYPFGTYSYAIQLILVFLLTDITRYKPTIIVTGISGILVWGLLLWSTSLSALQTLEVFYGTFMATEIAYYTYIYANVNREFYQKVTSHSRAAIFVGRFFASFMSQVLVYYQILDYKGLNYISLISLVLATIWSFCLPPVDHSIYFHRKLLLGESHDCIENEDAKARQPRTIKQKATEAFQLIWNQFKTSYSSPRVIQWSFWYAAGMCGYLQVLTYIQVLWINIDDTQAVVWNGAVEAVVTLVGALVSFAAGYYRIDKLSNKFNLLALMVVSILQGIALIIATETSYRGVSYIGYLIFCTLYSFVITVTSSEVAKHLQDECFGLVFGINTFVALAFQSVLTAVITNQSLELSIFTQYRVYVAYFLLVGLIYLGTYLKIVFKENWFV